jgi:hypothetical protein
MSTRPYPHRLRLVRGESSVLALPRGLRLVNLGGSVTLSAAPRWLGGTLLSPAWRIDAGGTHLIDESGWVRLQAQQDAELVLLAPVPSAWERFTAAWRGLALRPARLSASR